MLFRVLDIFCVCRKEKRTYLTHKTHYDISYQNCLEEEVDKDKSELNACGVITSTVMQDGFVPNQPENMDT